MNSSSPPLRSRRARPTPPLAQQMDNAHRALTYFAHLRPSGAGLPCRFAAQKGLAKKERGTGGAKNRE